MGYENDKEFAAFPTYPICFMFKGSGESASDVQGFPPPTLSMFPTPGLPGMRGVLDAEKYIEKVNEIPKNGAKLKMVGKTLVATRKARMGWSSRNFRLWMKVVRSITR